MKVTRGNNVARKRWLAGVILLVFSTSCATTEVSTNRAPQQSSGDPSSVAVTSAARAVEVTGVQVRAEGPGEASIVITADGALVDYVSFAEYAPPRLVIDFPHARNAISQPVTLPSGSPILRVQTMQIQQGPIPVLRLVFGLNQMLPYRVELTRNSVQILVSTEVSKPVPVAQEPTQLERVSEPVVSPIEPAATVPLQVAQPPAVSPPAAKEETPSPQIPQKSAAQAAAKRLSREASGEAGQEAPPSPSEAAKQPITPAPATSKVAAANKRLSLDFKGADLDDLLRLISEVSGLNIVAAHGLKDRKDRDVTVRLTNVEWRHALDVILSAKDLSYEQDGNVLYVGSRTEIQKSKPAPATSKVAAANKRLSLDFKGADLDDLLRLISEVSGLNIIAAHKIEDRKKRDVTVRLTNVEWRQALDVILRSKGLSYEQDGNVLYVGSKSEIQKSKDDRVKDIEEARRINEAAALKDLRIEEEKRKAEEERKKAQEEERRYAEEPICTKVIHLAYTKAPDVKKHLQRLRTRRGSIELEETTNTLVVNDVESVCLKMAALAKDLDMPPKDPFVTKLLPFNYAKAADLKTHLAAFKSKEGSIVVDERSSQIIIKDLPEAVERMETLLKQIDIRTPQVLIEARIVEATRKFSQSIGIQWGGAGIPTKPGSATGATAFGGQGQGIQFPTPTGTSPPSTTGDGVPFLPVPLALNLPAASPQFAIGATIGSLANRFLVGAQLTAAESEGKIRTLSSPRVATQDNEEAEIKQGTQVPYTTIDSSGRTVVQFQDAFIKLKVKPHITPDGRVSMKVEAERSFAGKEVRFEQGFVFPIETRKATTNILVQNGSTVVIGGLLQSNEAISTDKVPTLGNIPILGWLFKRRSIGPDERVELLIFITPSVLQESRP